MRSRKPSQPGRPGSFKAALSAPKNIGHCQLYVFPQNLSSWSYMYLRYQEVWMGSDNNYFKKLNLWDKVWHSRYFYCIFWYFETHWLIFFTQQSSAIRITIFVVFSALLMLSLNLVVNARCQPNECSVWNIVPYKQFFTPACNKHSICYACVRSVFLFLYNSS